jgi:hypothetical protein
MFKTLQGKPCSGKGKVCKVHQNSVDVIHNGGVTFRVVIHDSFVKLYRVVWDHDDRCTFLRNINYDEIWIGKDSKTIYECWMDIGTSVLLRKGNLYTFIGYLAYEFESDERVTKFESQMGSSAVPYPYALTKDSIFFLLDYKKYPLKEVGDLDDPYQWLYHQKDKTRKYKYHLLYDMQ